MKAVPEPTPATGSARPVSAEHRADPADNRVLRLIAIERTVRAVALVAIGVVLITHSHTDWGRTINDAARTFGFDPSRNGIQRLIDKVRAISPNRYVVFGVVAIGYGILEGVEGYGLWRRRRWAEYLTVVATGLLFIPEIYELIKRATAGKAAALVVNAAIVAFLVWRLRRHE
ncbi:MAG TPA: DUF2127 domain-containing protein [Solirubrobacteraceae bacterium]|nr:DUF2127 domain-containing protein [Solirubrobacteraceae bacterium]